MPFITKFEIKIILKLIILELPLNNCAALLIVTIADIANPIRNQNLCLLFSKGYRNKSRAETTI